MTDLAAIALQSAPARYDPVDPAHQGWAQQRADALLDAGTLDALSRLEAELSNDPVGPQLAVKLALSKARLNRAQAVTVVFAMFREHHRILPRAEHPHGEDFLRRKIEQLRWLFDSDEGWSLLAVDDGCPDGSGDIAARVIASEGWDGNARVAFLRDGIGAGHPATAGLRSTDDSQKGGAIQYGMALAAQHPGVVVFTDADLSTHLGQVGRLIAPILRDGYDAALGSRREDRSVTIKTGIRDVRGKLFIYFWKRLLAPLRHRVTDTQCGFKAFDAQLVRDVIPQMREKRFAFDIELLLRTELRRAGSMTRVPIAWIDSETASTTEGMDPYLAMLNAVVETYAALLPHNPDADSFAELIRSFDETSWGDIVAAVPPAIADADPTRFSDEILVSAHDLRV